MQKWLIKLKDTGPSGLILHFEGVIGGDYTLCGESISHDPDIYEKAPVRAVYGKVNCPNCIAIVEAVRKIKGNEIEK